MQAPNLLSSAASLCALGKSLLRGECPFPRVREGEEIPAPFL